VGNIKHSQVALYDTAAELRVDQLGNPSKETLPGVAVEVYVAGVGAKEADVAGTVVLRVPPVFTNLCRDRGALCSLRV
jgi:hypothetical protein